MLNIICIVILIAIIVAETISIFLYFRKQRQNSITEEDIISMVNESHEDGNILAKEAEMIQNIFEFSDKCAKDIMTHRKNIVCINANCTLKECLVIIKENQFSRYPVYDEDLDNIIGVLHIKDVLDCLEFENKQIKYIDNLIDEVEFIPETHRIDSLFAFMQSKKRHLVIILDEYGQLSGLLSMEDILEEIVGNIEDEHDEIELSISHNPDDSYIMEGSTTIEEVEDILGIKLSDSFETLNGYLISLLGKIPEDNSTFILSDNNYQYDIKNVSSKVIGQVIVKKLNMSLVE